MAKKKNIKFRPKDGGFEAYDADTGKSLGMVYDMSMKLKRKKKTK